MQPVIFILSLFLFRVDNECKIIKDKTLVIKDMFLAKWNLCFFASMTKAM